MVDFVVPGQGVAVGVLGVVLDIGFEVRPVAAHPGVEAGGSHPDIGAGNIFAVGDAGSASELVNAYVFACEHLFEVDGLVGAGEGYC